MEVDYTIIVTIVISTLTIIISNVGISVAMFLWVRSEANADRRDISNKLSESKSETTQMIFDMTNTIILESKEFHAKIARIEERNKGK